MKRRSKLLGLLAAAVLGAGLIVPAAAAAKAPPGDGFVKRAGPNLVVNGKPFDFVGTNNYYLMYSSQAMVNDVMTTAAANGFNVMRTWGWLDQTPKNGIVFQTFDGTSITYNDGATGLANLDYVVAEADKVGIKLVIPFTGNWGDFGGMDQYVAWAGGSFHEAMSMSLNLTTCGAWNGMLQQILVYTSGNAYLDNVWAK
jgi:mannan endo-1,4-beta-mannosidase